MLELRSTESMDWLPPVCRQDTQSFIFMAGWASSHMKPTACQSEKAKASSAALPYILVSTPKSLEEGPSGCEPEKVLLTIRVHKPDTRPYLTWTALYNGQI